MNPIEIIIQYKIKGILRHIEILQYVQEQDFTFKRSNLITKLKNQIKQLEQGELI